MLRAHRQAWAWQDEWVDLTINDIRKLEEDTARFLSKIMSNSEILKERLCDEDFIKESKNDDLKCQSSYKKNILKNNSIESDGDESLSMLKPNKNNENKNYDDIDSDDIFFDCYDKWSLISANEKNKVYF